MKKFMDSPIESENKIIKQMEALGCKHEGRLQFTHCDIPIVLDFSVTAENKVLLQMFQLFKKYGEEENFLKVGRYI